MSHAARSLATALLCLAAPVIAAHAQQAERVELSGSTIKLYNLIGTLEVVPATGGTASADVTRKGSDGARLSVRHSGGTLTIMYPGDQFVYQGGEGHHESTLRVREDGSFNGDWNDGGGRKVKISSRGSGLSAWADIRLALPAGARADLNIGVGRVTLTNVKGTISVQTSSGDVATTTTAGGLSIDTGSGDVTVTAHDGSLSVDTGSGDILMTGIKSDVLSLDTGSGDVQIRGLTAGKLSVDTGSGDVIVSEADVRSVNVDTGSGNVQVGLTGDVDDFHVDTGSGDVELSAPKSLGATVTIETSSGDISTEFPLQVTRKGRDGLAGTIGNGKGTLSIDTASGDVTLKQRP